MLANHNSTKLKFSNTDSQNQRCVYTNYCRTVAISLKYALRTEKAVLDVHSNNDKNNGKLF